MLISVAKTVEQYIQLHHLMDMDKTYLVAISGGADSVSLLTVLQVLGYHIEAAHCNFHLRGEESDRDEKFVRDLCEQKGIELHIAHFDTTEYASLHKISIEMAARELRYDYFEQLRKDLNLAGICVAHHRDDSVETLLMNLIRGTGIQGLSGIRPVNGYILRPLLCLSHSGIISYLSGLHQSYVTDSTNLDDNYLRNDVRIHVIPMLRSINPYVSECIQNAAECVADLLPLVNHALAEEAKKVTVSTTPYLVLSVSSLRKSLSPENTLYTILNQYGFPSGVVRAICEYLSTQATGGLFWAGSYQLVVDRDQIIISKKVKPFTPIHFPEEGIYVYSKKRRLNISVKAYDPSINLAVDRYHAFFDAGKLSFPLTLRSIEKGDKFVPFGMRGRKLLSNYMTDVKKNFFEKRKQLVLTDSYGFILWVVDERSDNRYRVTPSTKRIVCVVDEEV